MTSDRATAAAPPRFDDSQPGGKYGFWPTETQELLLRASLLPAEEARGAFEAWEARIDLDRLDGASVRLLPLLYHNLVSSQLAEGTPLRDRLRGIHRQAWYKNQLLLGAVSHLLARLSREGLPALMLKGVPLALEYYPSVATRPMSDADILIPDRCASRALEILLAAGFAPKFSDGDWPPRVTASRAFAGPDGWECDVHTRLMHECWEPGVDEGIWDAAVPLVVNGTPTSTLAPEDHALHVLAHGVRRNGLSPVRWIADFVMIVGRKRPFDWRRLQEEARRRRLSLLVHPPWCTCGSASVSSPRGRHCRSGARADRPAGAV